MLETAMRRCHRFNEFLWQPAWYADSVPKVKKKMQIGSTMKMCSQQNSKGSLDPKTPQRIPKAWGTTSNFQNSISFAIPPRLRLSCRIWVCETLWIRGSRSVNQSSVPIIVPSFSHHFPIISHHCQIFDDFCTAGIPHVPSPTRCFGTAFEEREAEHRKVLELSRILMIIGFARNCP